MLMPARSRGRIGVFAVAPLQLQFTLAAGLAAGALLVVGDLALAQRLAIAEGAVLIAAAGLAGLVVGEGRLTGSWLLLVPAADVAGILVMSRENATAGLGALLVFPVIWLATSWPARTVALGLVVVLVALWVPRIPGLAGRPVTVSTVTVGFSTSCALALVASMTWWVRRRSDAQHVLLSRQTVMLEGAFDRASNGEDTVRQVLDAVAFAVLGFDGNGQVSTANRAALELVSGLGLAPTSVLTALPFYHEDGFTPVRPEEYPIQRVLDGGEVEDEHYWLGHPGEARAALKVSTRVLRDRQGRLTQIVLVATDITAEQEALQARDDLAASISHELRTPLSSIIGYVDLALDAPDLSSEVREQLEVVSKNADRMLMLVNDLLAHREREAAGGLTVAKAPMDLVPVVLDSVAAVLPMARDRLITVDVDLPPALWVNGDALRLRQVVDNLLSNAIKYNREGGQITVTGATRFDTFQGELIELTIADSGRGMTPEESRRLFERFYRAPSVRQTAVRGSGLGLNISRELIDLHLGTIKVDSAPDVGTAMTVTLPALRHREDG